MLLGILGMRDSSGPVFIGQSALNVLPQVMKVHYHIVLKLVVVEAHLLLVDLFLACGPNFRLCQQLE